MRRLHVMSMWIGCVCAALMITANSRAGIDPEAAVGLWLLDEGDGETVGDSSGNGVDGVIMDDPQWVEGKFGKALEFDGDGDFVRIQEVEGIPTTGAFSVSAWIKYDDTDPAGVNPEVVTFGPKPYCPTGGVHAILLGAQTDVVIARGCGAEPSFRAAVPNPGVGNSEWHHIVTGYDGVSSFVYIDGKLKAESEDEDYERVTSFVHFGGRPDEDNTFAPYTGTIDEVGVFSATLSQADVNAIMARGLIEGMLPVSASGRLAAAWGQMKRTD